LTDRRSRERRAIGDRPRSDLEKLEVRLVAPVWKPVSLLRPGMPVPTLAALVRHLRGEVPVHPAPEGDTRTACPAHGKMTGRTPVMALHDGRAA